MRVFLQLAYQSEGPTVHSKGMPPRAKQVVSNENIVYLDLYYII